MWIEEKKREEGVKASSIRFLPILLPGGFFFDVDNVTRIGNSVQPIPFMLKAN